MRVSWRRALLDRGLGLPGAVLPARLGPPGAALPASPCESFVNPLRIFCVSYVSPSIRVNQSEAFVSPL